MYKAIINVMIEVHETKDNNITGNILHQEELNKYDIKSNSLVVIDGQTKNDCLTKLKEWLNGKS